MRRARAPHLSARTTIAEVARPYNFPGHIHFSRSRRLPSSLSHARNKGTAMRPNHIALAAVLTTTAAATLFGLAAQPDKTPPVRNPDLWPDKARPGDFTVPPGIYTSIL